MADDDFDWDLFWEVMRGSNGSASPRRRLKPFRSPRRRIADWRVRNFERAMDAKHHRLRFVFEREIELAGHQHIYDDPPNVVPFVDKSLIDEVVALVQRRARQLDKEMREQGGVQFLNG